MRRIVEVMFAAAGLLASGRPALGQTTSAAVAASFGAGLDSTTAASLVQVVDGARAKGLPVEPIVAKARLGLLRRAPGTLIVAAARSTAERLDAARTALAPAPTMADVVAGADALTAGVNADALRSLRRVAPARPLAVPLGVLAQLVASGVPIARATAIVRDLVKRGAPAGQLVALGNAVDGDVRAGERAEVSLGLRLRQLDAVLGPPGSAASAAAGICASATASPITADAVGPCVAPGGGQKKP